MKTIKLVIIFLLLNIFNLSYSEEVYNNEMENNYTINYSIQNNVLTYDIYRNDNQSFYYVDLLYHNYPTYLNLNIPNQKVNTSNIHVPFFSYNKNEKYALNINKIYDNYNSFNILYDSKNLNQIYIFPLTDLVNGNEYYFKDTKHLKGQIKLKEWIKKLKPFFSQNIKGKQKVSIIFILIHDPYFKSETKLKINTILNFDDI